MYSSLGLQSAIRLLQITAIILCLPGCQNSPTEYRSITQLLHQEFHDLHQQTTIVFVLADYDCGACVQSILDWCNEITFHSPTLRANGLYFQTDRFFAHQNILESTKGKVSWKRTSSITLLDLASEASPMKKGPYAIGLKKGKIKYVLPVNNFSFREHLLD